MPASLAYGSITGTDDTNPSPFLLTPILNLPPSFGSAYVGETFSCTLCANHDVAPLDAVPQTPGGGQLGGQRDGSQPAQRRRFIRDVRIEAEMKTPGSGSAVQKLVLGPQKPNDDDSKDDDEKDDNNNNNNNNEGTDLEPSQTLQRIVNFDLKEEGNHVLAVTVSYYEATETSGRTRTFRKLYQFICKGSLIVRTKVSALPYPLVPQSAAARKQYKKRKEKAEQEQEAQTTAGQQAPTPAPAPAPRSWAMEAQLENCSEDIMQLERVGLDLEPGLRYVDCNWEVGAAASRTPRATTKPVLHPGEVEQCCFVIFEDDGDGGGGERLEETEDGRVIFGVLGIGWRSEMGNKGFLSTGKLGARVAR